jgi:regulator of sirC expression with transglutaminase-like and TPR domain
MMRDAYFIDAPTALEYLKELGSAADEEIDIFEAALALALQEHPGKSADQYRQHIVKLAAQLREKYADLIEEDGLPEGAETRILALRAVMTRLQGYAGDSVHYDDIQNADIIRCIDRRLGMPITLSIVAIAAALKAGWPVCGLNFPGHFLIRFDGEKGKRFILDAFNLFAEVDAASMRQLLKANLGQSAELSAAYYEAASAREILIRLQNNIKFRLIEAEDYTGALACVEVMKLFAPEEYRLLFDEGILLSRLERPSAAIEALRAYLDKTPNAKDKMQVLSIINELTASMN